MTVRGSLIVGGSALAAMTFGSRTAQAHFYLQSPPAMYVQADNGDPQKAAPCGNAGASVPTNMVTTYQAGETITIMIDETIFHPGHYRVALAIDSPDDLPEEPATTPGGGYDCDTAVIDPAPVFPVLADGALVHTSPFGGDPQSIQVTLPDDIECTNCTLQIIQFMSAHAFNNPGGCYYHHCATIAIEADPSATTDGTGGSTGDSGPSTTSDGGTSNGSSASSTTASGSGTTSGSGGGTSDGGTDAGTGTGVDTEPTAMGEGDDGGCACTTTDTPDRRGEWLLLVLLPALRRRRVAL